MARTIAPSTAAEADARTKPGASRIPSTRSARSRPSDPGSRPTSAIETRTPTARTAAMFARATGKSIPLTGNSSISPVAWQPWTASRSSTRCPKRGSRNCCGVTATVRRREASAGTPCQRASTSMQRTRIQASSSRVAPDRWRTLAQAPANFPSASNSGCSHSSTSPSASVWPGSLAADTTYAWSTSCARTTALRPPFFARYIAWSA